MTETSVYSIILWLVTIATVSHVTDGADPVYTPQTLSDSVGNSADNTSTITWGDLPSGQPYAAANPSRISEGLKPYYDLVHSFINSVFSQGIPKELIEKGINGEMDDIIANYSNYISPFIGFAICIGIGILFMLIFPVIACCFCCCRCCGNCGGKKQQSPEDANNNCKKITFMLIVMIASIFIFVGSICIFINNNNISTMIDTIPDTATDNINDLKLFVNNTVNEATHILLDNFNFVMTALHRDLDNMGYLIGVPLKQDIDDNTNISDTLTNAYSLANSVDSMDNALTDVENKLTDFENSVNEFTTSIDAVKTNLNNIFVTCAGACPTTGKPDYSGASADIDTSQFPDLTSARTSMDSAKSQNLTQQIDDAKKEFDDIPSRVESDANSTVVDIKNTISDLNDTVADYSDQITDINSDVNGPSDTYGLNDWIDLIKENTDVAKTYDKYRWYGGVGLSSLGVCVVVFAVFGVIFGFFGSSIKTPPSERGCVSNCGGIFLMVATAVIFIFTTLLMLLTVLTFLPGAPLYKAICEPVTDLEKLEELISIYNDQQVGAGKYFLGDLIHQNDTIPLTVSGLLNDCKDGKSTFIAMKFDVKYDLDSELNYTDTLDVQAEIDAVNIDLSTVSIYPASLKTQLDDINDAVNISFADFYAELGNNVSTVNLSALADDIDAYANPLTDPTAKAGLEGQATELRRIESEEYAYVQGNLTALNTSVANMDATVSAIPALVDALDTGLQVADDYVKINASDTVKVILNGYADRILGIVDSFVAFTRDALLTKLGTCEPIWNFYNSVMVYTLCHNAMDGFNGFWFSLGWVIFFFMPALIFSVKTAKYFRTMDPLDDEPPPPYSDGKNPSGFRNINSANIQTPSRAAFWMNNVFEKKKKILSPVCNDGYSNTFEDVFVGKNKVAHRDNDNDW